MVDSPAAERTLDESEVRLLLSQAAPDIASLPLRLVNEGWDNATWRLGDDLAVRIPRRELAAPLILHEQQALAVLGPRLEAIGIRSPTPVLHGSPTDDFPWPWSIVPWIAGARALDRPRATNSAWAPDLARALRTLHRTAPADAPHNPVRGIPLAGRDQRMGELLGQLRTRTALPLGRAWADGLAAHVCREHVWVHGDLHTGNMVIDDHDRLAALIDFGDVTAGDPAYDLAVAWMAFNADGRNHFRIATGDRYDNATWTRARAWAASVAAILLAQSDDRADYFDLGHATAAEIEADERSG